MQMTSFSSPLLTERVPYDWEELKRAAQEAENAPAAQPSASDGGLIKLAPLPHRDPLPVHEEAAPHNQASEHPVQTPDEVQPAPAHEQPVLEKPSITEEELIAKIVPKVIERLNSQIEIIVDVTLKTAATRIRADLQKAVENTVRATLKEQLKK